MKKIFVYGDKNVFINYDRAIRAVGAEAVFSENVKRALDCDALLLAGGGDVSPCFYRSREKNCKSVSLTRDMCEQYLLARFERANAPVMGVCRGLQMINVYFSGTLAQSIEKARLHYDETRDVYHETENNSGFMRDIFGKNLFVNSCHRQKIDLPGKNVVPCAFSPDGVIEAAYRKGTKIFGVQFHPERPFSAAGDLSKGLLIYEYFLSLI